MCRHAAYVGPGIALSEVLRDVEHSLWHQSFQARELLAGVVCADGYGVAWYDADSGPDAARYAFPGPIWSDHNLATLAPRVRSHTVVAAVRNATVAGHNTEANCAPFTFGRWCLSHNGFLEDFAAWRPALVDSLSPRARNAIRGSTDSEHIFAMVLDAAERNPGDGLVSAVQEVCRTLLGEATRLGKRCQLNLLASDGDHVVATRSGSTPTQNSLYVLQDGEEFPGAVVLASEPLYDDAQWQAVAPDTVIAARAGAPLVRLTL